MLSDIEKQIIRKKPLLIIGNANTGKTHLLEILVEPLALQRSQYGPDGQFHAKEENSMLTADGISTKAAAHEVLRKCSNTNDSCILVAFSLSDLKGELNHFVNTTCIRRDTRTMTFKTATTKLLTDCLVICTQIDENGKYLVTKGKPLDKTDT